MNPQRELLDDIGNLVREFAAVVEAETSADAFNFTDLIESMSQCNPPGATRASDESIGLLIGCLNEFFHLDFRIKGGQVRALKNECPLPTDLRDLVFENKYAIIMAHKDWENSPITRNDLKPHQQQTQHIAKQQQQIVSSEHANSSQKEQQTASEHNPGQQRNMTGRLSTFGRGRGHLHLVIGNGRGGYRGGRGGHFFTENKTNLH